MKPRSPSAFTLIELIATISVVVILASLLVPSLKNAMQKASQTRCAANLKQIATALTLYATDNNGRTIACSETTGSNWSEILVRWDSTENSLSVWRGPSNMPAVPSLGVWRCPENRKQKVAPCGSGQGEHETSYQINGNATSAPSNAFISEENRYTNNAVMRMVTPSKLFMVMEGAYFKSDDTQDAAGVVPAGVYGTGARFVRYPHKKKVNVAFADGHVEILDGPLTWGTRIGSGEDPGTKYRADSWSNGYSWFAN